MDTKAMTAQSSEVQLAKASPWASLHPIFLNTTIFPPLYNNWEAKFKAWNHESRKNTPRKHNIPKLGTRNSRWLMEDHEPIFQCPLNNKHSMSKFFEVLARTY